MTHQLSPFRRWFELGLALDSQMIHPLPSTHGLRLRRRLRHLPALRLLAALFGGRGGVGIRIGAGSSLRRRLVMLVFDAGRRAISISMRGFLARAGEGAGEGAEEVEV